MLDHFDVVAIGIEEESGVPRRGNSSSVHERSRDTQSDRGAFVAAITVLARAQGAAPRVLDDPADRMIASACSLWVWSWRAASSSGVASRVSREKWGRVRSRSSRALGDGL